MQTTIVSLNVGQPEPLSTDVTSSIRKRPIDRLVVHMDHIEGDSFANTVIHGTPDRVLYALGQPSMSPFAHAMGREIYRSGTVGENVTLAAFDEHEVSVGDVFRFGPVIAEVTSPRLPCMKISLSCDDPWGLKTFSRCGRSGAYFRILEPGVIERDSVVSRVKSADHRFTVARVFEVLVNKAPLTDHELSVAYANPAFTQALRERLAGARAAAQVST